jgi:histone H3/H4
MDNVHERALSRAQREVDSFPRARAEKPPPQDERVISEEELQTMGASLGAELDGALVVSLQDEVDVFLAELFNEACLVAKRRNSDTVSPRDAKIFMAKRGLNSLPEYPAAKLSRRSPDASIIRNIRDMQ